MLGKTQFEFMFDAHTPLDKRKLESARIREKYPDRIPVIVEPSLACRKDLPIDKNKYLVPNDLTIAQFIYVIRKRIKLSAEQALFCFVGGGIPSNTTLMSALYDMHKSEDGFLKIVYSSESTFG